MKRNGWKVFICRESVPKEPTSKIPSNKSKRSRIQEIYEHKL